mmetsp:Transcript_104704/g.296294  ORF Transcript_104704/g.296294 Transcript_104704/m.296294 type:complete len:141 (+) Transcript_104704:36-458(+)
MAEGAPSDATHQGAQGGDLAETFLRYVRGCPHVLQSVRAFIDERAPAFAGLATSEEHKLEYHDIHLEYLALLQGHMEAFLKFKGASEEEFLEALGRARDEGAEEWQPFKMLLNKTDYLPFARMMQVHAVGIGPQGAAPPP